jgi:hypothetical protein
MKLRAQTNTERPMPKLSLFVIVRILFTALSARALETPADAADFATGVDLVGPAGASVEQQNALIGQLKSAGVHSSARGSAREMKISIWRSACMTSASRLF